LNCAALNGKPLNSCCKSQLSQNIIFYHLMILR